MRSLIKNLIIFVVVAVVIYFGYNLFFANNGLVLNTGSDSEGDQVAREFVVRLNELEQINFSRELFDDPRFRSLISFSTSPETVPAGRPNPFSR